MGNHSLISLGTILTGYTNIFCSKLYLIAKRNRIADQSKQSQVRSLQHLSPKGDRYYRES
jgi:hypothetical protein